AGRSMVGPPCPESRTPIPRQSGRSVQLRAHRPSIPVELVAPRQHGASSDSIARCPSLPRHNTTRGAKPATKMPRLSTSRRSMLAGRRIRTKLWESSWRLASVSGRLRSPDVRVSSRSGPGQSAADAADVPISGRRRHATGTPESESGPEDERALVLHDGLVVAEREDAPGAIREPDEPFRSILRPAEADVGHADDRRLRLEEPELHVARLGRVGGHQALPPDDHDAVRLLADGLVLLGTGGPRAEESARGTRMLFTSRAASGGEWCPSRRPAREPCAGRAARPAGRRRR